MMVTIVIATLCQALITIPGDLESAQCVMKFPHAFISLKQQSFQIGTTDRVRKQAQRGYLQCTELVNVRVRIQIHPL